MAAKKMVARRENKKPEPTSPLFHIVYDPTDETGQKCAVHVRWSNGEDTELGPRARFKNPALAAEMVAELYRAQADRRERDALLRERGILGSRTSER